MLIEPITLPCESSGAASSRGQAGLAREFRIAIQLLVVDVGNNDG